MVLTVLAPTIRPGTPGEIVKAPADLELPLRAPDASWPRLRDTFCLELSRTLQRRLRAKTRWARLIDQKKLSVGLVDLHDVEAIRFAAVNGETMMYAASLPKIAVLLAAFQTFEDGGLEESPEVSADLEGMIRVSSNAAATRMIERLGFERIASVLTDPSHQLYDSQNGGGLWVGRAYAKGGGRKPDPILGLVHGANTVQVCRFYYLLATGRLLNQRRSQEMLSLLSNTAKHHKFIHYLKDRVALSNVYRKSGTWKRWHSDSILVWEADRRYILVALVEDEHGESILRELVPLAEAALIESRPH